MYGLDEFRELYPIIEQVCYNANCVIQVCLRLIQKDESCAPYRRLKRLF